MHGGATPRGVNHPSWKGRGYSKDLPAQLRDRFMASVEDPHLLSCRSELALIDARLGEVIEAGVSTRDEWGQVFGLVDLRRKVANSEARREAMLQTHLTMDQARTLVGCVVEVVLKEDADVRLRVMGGLRRLMAERGLVIAPTRQTLPSGA
jgi:hypothetical protein